MHLSMLEETHEHLVQQEKEMGAQVPSTRINCVAPVERMPVMAACIYLTSL